MQGWRIGGRIIVPGGRQGRTVLRVIGVTRQIKRAIIDALSGEPVVERYNIEAAGELDDKPAVVDGGPTSM